VKIEIHTHGDYQVLTIAEELSVISDLSELMYIIQGYLQQGKRHIAVGFSEISYIYSGAVAVLINCHKKIKSEGGELCIVEPNKDISAILDLINIHKVIPIYQSEDDLPIVGQGE
jgi:stage II sporulation protein AA (anti-sigma F factor antagonist)